MPRFVRNLLAAHLLRERNTNTRLASQIGRAAKKIEESEICLSREILSNRLGLRFFSSLTYEDLLGRTWRYEDFELPRDLRVCVRFLRSTARIPVGPGTCGLILATLLSNEVQEYFFTPERVSANSPLYAILGIEEGGTLYDIRHRSALLGISHLDSDLMDRTLQIEDAAYPLDFFSIRRRLNLEPSPPVANPVDRAILIDPESINTPPVTATSEEGWTTQVFPYELGPITVGYLDNKMFVASPYNARYIGKLKSQINYRNRSWDSINHRWLFHRAGEAIKTTLRDLLLEFFQIDIGVNGCPTPASPTEEARVTKAKATQRKEWLDNQKEEMGKVVLIAEFLTELLKAGGADPERPLILKAAKKMLKILDDKKFRKLSAALDPTRLTELLITDQMEIGVGGLVLDD